MNQVRTKQLQLHFQRLYPGQATLSVEELAEALKLIEGTQQNQVIGYAIKSKIEDKNNPEDQVGLQELQNRISSTISDAKDSMYIDAYFKLIDNDSDGFINYQDLQELTQELGYPCMNQKAFLALTDRFQHDSTKLSKAHFADIIREYV